MVVIVWSWGSFKMKKNIFLLLSWILGILFFLIFVLGLFSKHFLPSLFILFILVLLIPPLRQWLSDLIGISIPIWFRVIVIPILLFIFIFLIFMGMGNKHSIYKNPEIKQKLMTIYKNRMDQWPVPYESRYLQTQYGKVFVIICGAQDAPPVFLLHASAMASWSWLYNIEGLAQYYRIYAIDTIGDAGRSILNDISVYPADGQSLTDLYCNLMDSLGVHKVYFIGASQGGFISTNIAIHMPERVEKLILCGPMGYGGTTISVLRILFTTMFPLRSIQRSTTRWAFGNDPEVNKAVGEWFPLILEGVISRQARPQPITQEQLEQLNMPVLLILGKRDGLVGDPENTIQLVKDIPNIKIKLLDTGHLISAEKPDQFNNLIVNFIENSRSELY
jgi:pimeloyl-ACP methyl ester carboxylesterase